MLYQLTLKNNIIVISKRDTVDSRKQKKKVFVNSLLRQYLLRGGHSTFD